MKLPHILLHSYVADENGKMGKTPKMQCFGIIRSHVRCTEKLFYYDLEQYLLASNNILFVLSTNPSQSEMLWANWDESALGPIRGLHMVKTKIITALINGNFIIIVIYNNYFLL